MAGHASRFGPTRFRDTVFFPAPARLCVALFLLGGAAGGRAHVSVPPVRHPGAGRTIYFLVTDRFANGFTANDTGGIAGGPDRSGFDPARISHDHGGDFSCRPLACAPSRDATVKHLAWRNDVMLDRNRGNRTLPSAGAVHGAFASLDERFTEYPRVLGRA